MKKTFIPFVANEAEQIDWDKVDLFSKIRVSKLQGRTRMVVDSLLAEAAQNKADDMVVRHYFSHTSPDGISANQNIRNTGYILPDWYPVDSNNCESLAWINGNDPGKTLIQTTIDLWANSPAHVDHVFGRTDFYKGQECIGVGKAVTDTGKTIFTFLSAPCME